MASFLDIFKRNFSLFSSDIGIDLGTSACKLLLVGEDGTIQNEVTKEYPLIFPHPGWSEQKPEDWWSAVVTGVPELLRGFDASQVAGIGSGGKIVCIVYHNTLRMIFRPCILVATIASVNPHLLCSSFLSTSILDRRTSGIFTPISPAFSKIETASFKINPMQTASRR